MNYLVDGYNLFFRITKTPSPLQKKRELFLKMLDEEIAEARLHVTVIFDSSDQRISGIARRDLEAIEVIFTSQGLSADEYILEKISTSQNPKQQVVVTQDRELVSKAKMLGASALSIDEFFALVLKKRAAKCKTDLHFAFKDTDANIERLLKIFEDKLKNSEP